jgi:hypothetical protein
MMQQSTDIACMVYDPMVTNSTKYETPSSEGCQYYMAERCSNDWDGICDQYYIENTFNTNRGFPNTTAILPFFKSADLGTTLLINSATIRFFDNIGDVWYEPLNPMDSDTPMIKKYKRPLLGYQRLVLSNRINSNTIDSDPIIQRLLLSSDKCRDFLNLLFQHLMVASKTDKRLLTTQTLQYLHTIL